MKPASYLFAQENNADFVTANKAFKKIKGAVFV